MKELKITIGGAEYSAPPPLVKQYKDYLKFLRASGRAKESGSDEDIDAEFSFLASVFQNPAVTPESLEEISFSDAAQLRSDLFPWLSQYLPDSSTKNA